MPGDIKTMKNNSKTIKKTCKTNDSLDWHLIKPLQGNFKKRTQEDIQKLCNLIKKHGFAFPSLIAKIKREGFLDNFSIPEIKFDSGLSVEVKYKEKTELIVECEDESQAKELYTEFNGRGLKCRISTL